MRCPRQSRKTVNRAVEGAEEGEGGRGEEKGRGRMKDVIGGSGGGGLS